MKILVNEFNTIKALTKFKKFSEESEQLGWTGMDTILKNSIKSMIFYDRYIQVQRTEKFAQAQRKFVQIGKKLAWIKKQKKIRK